MVKIIYRAPIQLTALFPPFKQVFCAKGAFYTLPYHVFLDHSAFLIGGQDMDRKD